MVVQHITVNCSFTKLSSHGYKNALKGTFRSYAYIYIFNLDFNKIEKNEFDLFDNLLKMPI